MIKISDWHFEILGITSQATSDDVKMAFKSLIKKCHPDLFQNDKDKIEATLESQKLIEAYDLLKDYNSPINTVQSPIESTNSNTKQRAECDWQNISRTRVRSSNTYAIGYDSITNTLIVEFKDNKAIYLYYNVPIEEFEKILNTESKGERFMGIYSYKYSRVF